MVLPHASFRPAITDDALALLVLSFRLDSVDFLYLSSGALTPGVRHVCHARHTLYHPCNVLFWGGSLSTRQREEDREVFFPLPPAAAPLFFIRGKL